MKPIARDWTLVHLALAAALLSATAREAGAEVLFDTFNADGTLPDTFGGLADVGWQATYPLNPGYPDVPGASTCVPLIQLFSINEGVSLASIEFVTVQAVSQFGEVPILSGSAGLYRRQDDYHAGPVTFTPVGLSATFNFGTESTNQALTPSAPLTLEPGVYALVISGRNFAPSFLSEHQALPAFAYQQSRSAVGLEGDDLTMNLPLTVRTASTGNRLQTLTASTIRPLTPFSAIQSTLRYPDGSVADSYIDHSQPLTMPGEGASVPWRSSPEHNGPMVMRIQGAPTGVVHPERLPLGNVVDDLHGVTQIAVGGGGTNPIQAPACWRGTNYVERTASFTATGTRTRISFAFVTDRHAMALTNVRVVRQGEAGAPNLLANGDFAADSTTNRSVMIPEYQYVIGLDELGRYVFATGGETVAPVITQPAGWTYTPADAPIGVDGEQRLNALIDGFAWGAHTADFLDDPSIFDALRFYNPFFDAYVYPFAREVRLITGVTSDGVEPGTNAFSITSFGGYSTLSQVIPTVVGETYEISYSYRVTLADIVASQGFGVIRFSHDLDLLRGFDPYHANYNLTNLAVYADACVAGNTSGDGDGAGVPDCQDVCPGGDDNVDADSDGIPDSCDPCVAERGGACPADVNCDGTVDFFDVDPFLLALFDPAGYAMSYPSCTLLAADIDRDGFVDFFDIDPFVACLFAGGCP